MIERAIAPAAVVAALAAAMILLWFLGARPALVRSTKVWLFFGLGVFPIAAALGGNVVGFERSKQVQFCGSCHVMEPHVEDARDETSTTLGSMHSRNARFGEQSCYVCHADYRLFGAVVTKLHGTRHLWAYYTKYRDPDQAHAREIALYAPFPNGTCRGCHSGRLPGFEDEPEHQAVLEDLRSDAIGCASEGCHGPAHPEPEP